MNTSGKKSILVIDAGYFLTREVSRAFSLEGHNVIPVPMPFNTGAPVRDPKDYSMFLRNIIDAYQQHRPDFLLTLNHLGFDADGKLTELLDTLQLPALVWYVDSPRYILLDNRANVSEWTALFLWDLSYEGWLRKAGFDKVHELSLATDPGAFLNPSLISAPSLHQDLIFVGDSMRFAVEKALGKLPPQLNLDQNNGAREEVISFFNQFCYKLLISPKSCENAAWKIYDAVYTKIDSTDEPGLSVVPSSAFESTERLNFESALVLASTRLQRFEYVKALTAALAPGGFVIYGDDGWKSVLNGAANIRPPVDYYNELPVVYCNAGGVINLTSYQMPMGLNQRCYDVPAAGGFLLTDNQESLHRQFEPGTEIVTFTNPDELMDKWNYYKIHVAERQQIINRGRERILKEHTYQHRVNEMLGLAGKWF